MTAHARRCWVPSNVITRSPEAISARRSGTGSSSSDRPKAPIRNVPDAIALAVPAQTMPAPREGSAADRIHQRLEPPGHESSDLHSDSAWAAVFVRRAQHRQARSEPIPACGRDPGHDPIGGWELPLQQQRRRQCRLVGVARPHRGRKPDQIPSASTAALATTDHQTSPTPSPSWPGDVGGHTQDRQSPPWPRRFRQPHRSGRRRGGPRGRSDRARTRRRPPERPRRLRQLGRGRSDRGCPRCRHSSTRRSNLGRWPPTPTVRGSRPVSPGPPHRRRALVGRTQRPAGPALRPRQLEPPGVHRKPTPRSSGRPEPVGPERTAIPRRRRPRC